METLYGSSECLCPTSLFSPLKDLIERPFEVEVKILVHCNALQFSKVCFHCSAENGGHSWPTQRQNLKHKAWDNYYAEVVDHFVQSIRQYNKTQVKLQRCTSKMLGFPEQSLGKIGFW